MTLLPIAEAQARLFTAAPRVAEETVPLAQAAGRWLAADVVAQRTQPAHDLSAMDGYAIRFADLPGPWTLIGESAAGRPFDGTIQPRVFSEQYAQVDAEWDKVVKAGLITKAQATTMRQTDGG